jgi:hypothetical protein
VLEFIRRIETYSILTLHTTEANKGFLQRAEHAPPTRETHQRWIMSLNRLRSTQLRNTCSRNAPKNPPKWPPS